MFYEGILEAYNICIKQEILTILKTRSKSVNFVEALKNLDEIELIERDKIKNETEMIIFLITKSYIASDLFKKHCEEAKLLEKPIWLLLLEDGLVENQIQFKNYKLFQFKLSTQNLDDFQLLGDYLKSNCHMLLEGGNFKSNLHLTNEKQKIDQVNILLIFVHTIHKILFTSFDFTCFIAFQQCQKKTSVFIIFEKRCTKSRFYYRNDEN